MIGLPWPFCRKSARGGNTRKKQRRSRSKEGAAAAAAFDPTCNDFQTATRLESIFQSPSRSTASLQPGRSLRYHLPLSLPVRLLHQLTSVLRTIEFWFGVCSTLTLFTVLVAAAAPQSPAFGKGKPPNKARPVQFRLPIWLGAPSEKAESEVATSNLKITADKAPIKVSAWRGPESPALLFVALDLVGDIATADQARKAIVDEVHALSIQFWAGLISGQEQMFVVQEPTGDRVLFQQKLQELTQIGKAGLLESVQPVADLATGVLLNSEVRVAIVFITDSDIGNYRADYLNPPVNASDGRDLSRRFAGRELQEKISRMAQLMARNQVPLFIVHIDPGLDPLNRSYHNGLKQLAEVSGGKCLLSKSRGDIPLNIHEAFQWAKSFHLAEFTLEGPKRGYKRLEVELAEDRKSLALRLVHPARVFLP